MTDFPTPDATAPTALLLALAIGLTIFDATSTYVLVTTGVAREANPWLAITTDHYGIANAMTIRSIVGIGLLVTLHGLTHRSPLAKHGLTLTTSTLGITALVHVRGLMLV